MDWVVAVFVFKIGFGSFLRSLGILWERMWTCPVYIVES